MFSIVKDVLMSWHRSFVGKKRRKAWRATPLSLFLIIWNGRYKREHLKYRKIGSSNQTILHIYNFLKLVRVYIGNCSLPMICALLIGLALIKTRMLFFCVLLCHVMAFWHLCLNIICNCVPFC